MTTGKVSDPARRACLASCLASYSVGPLPGIDDPAPVQLDGQPVVAQRHHEAIAMALEQ